MLEFIFLLTLQVRRFDFVVFQQIRVDEIQPNSILLSPTM